MLGWFKKSSRRRAQTREQERGSEALPFRPAKLPPRRPEPPPKTLTGTSRVSPTAGASPESSLGRVSIDSGVIFDFPASWRHYRTGNKCVFESPGGEQVIISAFTISPPRPSAERDTYLEEIFQNGLQAAREAIQYHDFRVIKA